MYIYIFCFKKIYDVPILKENLIKKKNFYILVRGDNTTKKKNCYFIRKETEYQFLWTNGLPSL